jgi:hypothetical protein
MAGERRGSSGIKVLGVRTGSLGSSGLAARPRRNALARRRSRPPAPGTGREKWRDFSARQFDAIARPIFMLRNSRGWLLIFLLCDTARSAAGGLLVSQNGVWGVWLPLRSNARWRARLTQFLIWHKADEAGIGFILKSMPLVLYRCPRTGLNVQGFVADDPTEGGGDNYVPVECLACSGIHLVNPATGKVLGEDDE